MSALGPSGPVVLLPLPSRSAFPSTSLDGTSDCQPSCLVPKLRPLLSLPGTWIDPFSENWSNYFIVVSSIWPLNVTNARFEGILAPIGSDEKLKRNAGGEPFLKLEHTRRGTGQKKLSFIHSFSCVYLSHQKPDMSTALF